MLVNEKVAGVSPATAAVTEYEPAMLFAVGRGDVAIPDELVTAVTEALPLKVSLAPLEGAVNVTVTPETGVDEASITFA